MDQQNFHQLVKYGKTQYEVKQMYVIRGAVYVFSGALETLIPFGLGFMLRRRLGVSWRWFFVGALMFLASLIRFPLNQYVYSAVLTQGFGNTMTMLILAAFPSLTAAVFEEGARYIAYRYVFDEHGLKEGLMYGAGHGGIESVFIVGINVLTMGILLLVNPSYLPQPILESILMSPAYLPLVGLYERLGAMTLQIGLSVMVLEYFRRRDVRYLVGAVALHFLVDFVALATLGYGWVYPELALTVVALGMGYWMLRKAGEEGLIA
jgi:uncharacterized membrane protein YhfC